MATSEELLQSLRNEMKDLTSTAEGKLNEVELRMLNLEQRADAQRTFRGNGGGDLDPGTKLIESSQYKSFASNGLRSSGKVVVADSLKTALINAVGQNQPLVPADRVEIVPPANQRLMIQDALPHSTTNSNAIEYAKESAFTNNAAPQYSAGAYENVTKAESALTFNLTSLPISTIAHWLPVSNQILDDAAGLQSYVNGRLIYGLRKKIEDELLTGSGIQGHLSGLITNGSSFDTNYSAPTTDSYLDTVRKAALQLTMANFNPDLLIVAPLDWDTLISTKESGTGISSGQYIFANPAFMPRQQVWGMNVVVSNSCTTGEFVVLDSSYTTIFDRAPVTVEVSREHSDFFVRNMSALLVECRMALAIFNSSAVIHGGFPFGS